MNANWYQALRALYNNLGKDEGLAIKVDAAVQSSRQDGWRDNTMKTKKVRQAIRMALAVVMPADLGLKAQETGESASAPSLESETDRILDIARHQHDY